jgi:hypothetical protein
MDFVAQKLYPVKHIQHTLANVYAQILEFCIRATKWYDQVQRNLVRAVFRAVIKTWPLEFQDIRSNVDMYFRRLREQSAIAHQAETRDIHAKIADILVGVTYSLQRGFGRISSAAKAGAT